MVGFGIFNQQTGLLIYLF